VSNAFGRDIGTNARLLCMLHNFNDDAMALAVLLYSVTTGDLVLPTDAAAACFVWAKVTKPSQQRTPCQRRRIVGSPPGRIASIDHVADI
jgi:hypothetical protein